uniref:Chemokine interleukin-8-like domain-containing protein n=1 Tax=Chelydra serpentina TaxID=8475 RepID=A0A8C3S2I1_CHESE
MRGVRGNGLDSGLSPPPLAGELRCQCLQTEAGRIPLQRIARVQRIPEGPHCGVPEVIATMKNGEKVCLEPTAPWVKLMVNRILMDTSDHKPLPHQSSCGWGGSCH